MANTPLDGFVILDLTQFYQGPYATMMLAKAGANVIKIEPPKGESLRGMAPAGKTGSYPVAALNANKLGVTLDLKTGEGRDLLKRMVLKADALVENYSPGVMDRLGVGWSVLSELNPRLVYASATGYGLSGPDRDNLAMDFTIQAASGVMSLTGYADGPPLRTGAPYVDILGGAHLYGGLMTALLERERTGRGRLVEVAMVEAVFASLATAIDQYHRAGEKIPARTGNAFANFNRAPYNVYEAEDGHVAIILVTEAQWQNLLRAMGREDLKDDLRFIKNDARGALRRDRGVGVRLDRVPHARRNLRGDKPVQDPVRSGARPGGDAERPPHARPRHAGGRRSLRLRSGRAAELAVALPWHG
jgi:CoA:oxalate CoA-transferase